jgi:hypothetical protein
MHESPGDTSRFSKKKRPICCIAIRRDICSKIVAFVFKRLKILLDKQLEMMISSKTRLVIPHTWLCTLLYGPPLLLKNGLQILGLPDI